MQRKLLLFILANLMLAAAVFSQEIEAASSSNLTQASLSGNAQRLLPASIPADIRQTLKEIASAGGGKLRQGDSEVLVWAGKEYQAAGKAATINRLIESLKIAGWQYEKGGEQDGIAIFSLLKDGPQRRAMIGFYGESDGILVLAWTELLQNGASTIDPGPGAPESEAPLSAGGEAKSIIGAWDNGSVSTVTRQNTITGATTPGRSTRFEYRFNANGSFSFTGLAQTQNFGCSETLYNEKAGRYTLSGNTLTLIPSKNFWRKSNSCSPAGNSERNYKLDKEIYEFSTKTDDYGKQLICLANSNGESCYRRKAE